MKCPGTLYLNVTVIWPRLRWVFLVEIAEGSVRILRRYKVSKLKKVGEKLKRLKSKNRHFLEDLEPSGKRKLEILENIFVKF